MAFFQRNHLMVVVLPLVAALALTKGYAAAEDRLVVYCSAQHTMCEQEIAAFQEKYGIKTSFIRGGTGQHSGAH